MNLVRGREQFFGRLARSLGNSCVLSVLLLLCFFLGGALPAMAEEKFCSDYPNGIIDGFIDPVPIQITIDRDCTFQNFPETKPLTATLNFQTNDPSIYLIVFNNVIFTGHMACANVDHRIWFANGSDYGSSNSCQDLFIPVESIDKQSPGPVATIGEPFTYTLTFPSMTVVGGPSLNDLHSVTLWDDLNATGADLTFVSLNAYLKSTGQPVTLEPETDPTAPGGVWTAKNLSYKPYAGILPAGEQLIVEITVVPDNTQANAAGRTFVNTAKWSFGRLIEGVFYEPLPGEWGVSEPMTIAEPSLVVNKTSNETAINFGTPATFTIDIQNIGGSEAWNATILDQLPDGMCDQNPILAPGFSAKIVDANGTTVSNLVLNTDYTATFSGDPACSLSLNMVTDQAIIAPLQHLVLTYQSELDGDINTDGLNLVNVAGATQWLSADPGSGAGYRTFDRTLTDGTPNVVDYQDSQVVTTALSGYYFQKTVQNLNSGANPASIANPGDRLRYRVRLFNVDETINGVAIRDQLDLSRFDPTTFALITPLPAGTSYNFNPGTGLLQISGNSGPLDIPVGGELIIEFELNLRSNLTTGTLVSNQASMVAAGINTVSDDPYVNGISPSDGDPPPDPTVVLIQAPGPPAKANTQGVSTIGEQFQYTIKVPSVPVGVPMYDIRISDNLTAYGADMRFVSANVVSGGNWALLNTGTATQPIIEDTTTGIDIPAGGQAVIEITVELENSIGNQDGNLFINRAEYTYNRINGDETSRNLGGAASTDNMSVVEPFLTVDKEVRFISPAGKPSSNPGVVGDVLEYTVTVSNAGTSTAFDVSIIDSLSGDVSLITGSAAAQINGADVIGFQVEPLVRSDGAVIWGQDSGDGSLDIPVGQSLVIRYQARIEIITSTEIINNVYVNWTSLDGTNTAERTGAGCPVITSPNDYCAGPAAVSQAAQVDVSLVKSVVRVTPDGDELQGDSAEPKDKLRYTLTIANLSDSPLINGTLTDELAPQFVPGSLQQPLDENGDPVDADTTLTDPSGGSNGTGLVEIHGINLAAQGETNDSLTIVFEATLVSVIQNGTEVVNQAQLTGDNLSSAASNKTVTRITSSPVFEVWKTSEEVGGDSDTLLAGDTLRYTITVKNVGNENAVNSVLRDQAPANTTYVPGSTTLNGNSQEDIAGVPPLQGGLLIHAPEDSAEGLLKADPDNTRISNVATVTFDVLINSDVVDGTIIANQGFFNAIGAGSGPVPEEPSDDPNTTVLDDPTRDVVGSLPLIDVQKTAELVDIGVDQIGIVNPGETLHYIITIVNTGPKPATGVVFRDPIPANTTFKSGTAKLNGEVIGDPVGGVLIFDVSSSDLALPALGSGQGTLSPGETATISFDVLVNGGVEDGTIISNQGVVISNEQADEPTDADGIDSNGDQPTQVVVGNVQQLSILKEVYVVDGTTAQPDQLLEYVVRVTNIGSQSGTNIVITDDLGQLAGQASYIANSATLDGSRTGVNYADTVLTGILATLPAGEQAVLRFRVRIEATVVPGTTLTNTGEVTWDTAPNPEEASVSLDVGGTPGSAILNGNVWHDADLDSVNDDTELDLEGWSVSLYSNNQLLATVQTNNSGSYRLSGLNPAGGAYEIRFLAAGAGPNTPSLGMTSSPFTDGPQHIGDIFVTAGGNLQNLNLPITPNGVVYDSVNRSPVAGTMVTLQRAATGTPLSVQCFADPLQQNQVTAADGFYKFDLKFGDASCPDGEAYYIAVTPPANGYEPGTSQIIKAGREVAGSVMGGDPFYQEDPNNPPSSVIPFSVPACPGSTDDALPGTTDLCEITTSANPPQSEADETTYYLTLTLDDNLIPGQSQAFNNHLPIDPVLDEAVTITKTSPLINVTKGQLVPYTITVSNQYGAPLNDLSIVDIFPAGFKFVEGSALLDGREQDPVRIDGRQLTWENINLPVDGKRVLQLLLVVGAGVAEDKYTNQAQVYSASSRRTVSAVATATVRVVPDPTFDCTDVIGKVFDDRNLDGQQDPGELGLPGVQVVTTRGLVGTTDEFGRFHITCAIVPDENRGSNFILKLDDHTLPTGYRLTTENPRVQRATRGKMMKFNFGATIHRVVGLDFADGVFEPDKTELRVQWHTKLKQLIEELKKAPSVLRLSYLADVEPKDLVRDRVEAIRGEIARLWDLADGSYPLSVETEVFWRRGGSR